MSKINSFRVWDVNQNCYVHENFLCSLLIDAEGSLHRAQWNSLEDCSIEKMDEKKYFIERFSGFQDSDGKDVYEGDLINHHGEICFVYHSAHLGWVLRPVLGDLSGYFHETVKNVCFLDFLTIGTVREKGIMLNYKEIK